MSIEVGCCARDTRLTNVTCGRGTSCTGQCSAIEASLCPSGNCTGDPEDCRQRFELEEGDGFEKRRSAATRPSWEFGWCVPACRVRYHSACCYHPTCRAQRGQLCSWMNYFTGGFLTDPELCPNQNTSRQLVPQTWQHSPRRVELPDAGNPDSRRHFLGRRRQHLPW